MQTLVRIDLTEDQTSVCRICTRRYPTRMVACPRCVADRLLAPPQEVSDGD